ERVPDVAERRGPAGAIIDLIGKRLAGIAHPYSPLALRDSSAESRYNCAIPKPAECPCPRRLPPFACATSRRLLRSGPIAHRGRRARRGTRMSAEATLRAFS